MFSFFSTEMSNALHKTSYVFVWACLKNLIYLTVMKETRPLLGGLPNSRERWASIDLHLVCLCRG